MEIKLPRLNLDYSEKEGFSLGKLEPALIIGFGIHWAWVYLTMFSGEMVFFGDKAHSHETATTFYVCSLVFFVLTFFTYALASHFLRQLLATKKSRLILRLIGAFLASAGTFLMCLADATTTSGFVFLLVSGVGTGIGSVILLMSYGVSFGQCDTATIVTSTALALVVGMLAYALLLALSTWFTIAAIVIIALIPFVEYYCLYRSSSILVDKLEFATITLKVHKGRFAARICIPSLLFGFALGTLRSSTLSESLLLADSTMRIICVLAAGILACLILILTMMTQKQTLNFLFRPLIPLITVSLIWYCLGPAFDSAALNIVLLTGYMLFESVMWINYGDISQRFRLTAFIVFGFGRGSLALGALIGSFILGTRGFGSLDMEAVVILSLSALLIGYVVLPRASEISKLVIGESDKPADEVGPKIAAETEETIKFGRFKRKCEEVANRYLLSKKETEVLFLLAKGRNAAYVQEQLYISEGTARTHMRHIYKKLNIHTQQELIDLVESVEVEPVKE